MLRLVMVVMQLAVLGGAALADDRVEAGRVLANSLCAGCHLNPGQGAKLGPAGAPGFEGVANRKGQTRNGIVAWLRSRPSNMPDHHLTWDEADALATFILSLRDTK